MEVNQGLLLIDIQNDFCPHGALPVPEGDKIIPFLNKYIAIFQKANFLIAATRDWHPPVTKHFKQYGGLWPAHCIQNTWGAQFHPSLELPADTIIFTKGTAETKEGYSGFDGVDPQGIPMYNFLQSRHISTLSIGGLATDYCVKRTVLDALNFGFKVNLLTDAIKGIDLRPGDSQRSINEMSSRGAQLKTLETIMST